MSLSTVLVPFSLCWLPLCPFVKHKLPHGCVRRTPRSESSSGGLSAPWGLPFLYSAGLGPSSRSAALAEA